MLGKVKMLQYLVHLKNKKQEFDLFVFTMPAQS